MNENVFVDFVVVGVAAAFEFGVVAINADAIAYINVDTTICSTTDASSTSTCAANQNNNTTTDSNSINNDNILNNNTISS